MRKSKANRLAQLAAGGLSGLAAGTGLLFRVFPPSRNSDKLLNLCLSFLGLGSGAFAALYSKTYNPKPIERPEILGNGKAIPALKPGQVVKTMVWNVQYMASKNYIFFYDRKDGDGPHWRPSKEDITKTIEEVARVVKDEDPDFILFQEIHQGSRSTDYENQTDRLRKLIPKEYAEYSEAFYYKVPFVPHPRIWGSVGMKLTTFSKYRIDKSVRYSLPHTYDNLALRLLGLKRAILETTIPVKGGKNLVVMNTHLEAFAQGTDTMERQVHFVYNHLRRLDAKGKPWMIAGDFNLMPPGIDINEIEEKSRYLYKDLSEIEVLFDRFQSAFTLEDLQGPDRAEHFTHWPNDETVDGPNRTIDFLFHSKNLGLKERYVRSGDTQRISDHLPIVAEFKVPG